ncbi:hypothetical protein CL618_02080 [archaeon]|nr:hypothetical protein [archaeon]|tara:strand:- start:259 stop:804 length:546 start_codon:yes stop_codon:yes gene_type:complete
MKKPNWRLWLKDEKECKSWLDYYTKKKILRKRKDESKLYLKKTDHNLHLANWIMEKHKDEIPEMFGEEKFYDWTINMYYYAIYHSAMALVSKKNYSSKNHSATLCFLIYHFCHLQENIDEEDVELIVESLNKEDVETIGSSKEIREKASYDIHETFEYKLADDLRKQTIELINKIKLLIEK